MKKLLFAVLITVAMAGSALATPTTVSYKVQNRFSKSFTNASNVTWKITENFVKATFEYKGGTMNAFYTNDGDLIATSKVFPLEKLPKEALNTITNIYLYPTYQLKDCIEVTTAEGEKNYYVLFTIGLDQLVLYITEGGEIDELSGLGQEV